MNIDEHRGMCTLGVLAFGSTTTEPDLPLKNVSSFAYLNLMVVFVGFSKTVTASTTGWKLRNCRKAETAGRTPSVTILSFCCVRRSEEADGVYTHLDRYGDLLDECHICPLYDGFNTECLEEGNEEFILCG